MPRCNIRHDVMGAHKKTPCLGVSIVLHFDFDVAARWEREVHQRVNGLWRWLGDVDQALVYTHLELLAALLVYMRALNHCKSAAVGWQRDWTSNGSARAQRSINDLLCGLVNYFVVVGL